MYGKGRDPGGVAFLACSALLFLGTALLVWRGSRTTLDGTILTFRKPPRRRRYCDLARVDAARVSFEMASIGDGAGQIGSMRMCELCLEGGGDLAVVELRQGLRWPRPEDLRSLADALQANPNAPAVAPAIATLTKMADNGGRPPV